MASWKSVVYAVFATSLVLSVFLGFTSEGEDAAQDSISRFSARRLAQAVDANSTSTNSSRRFLLDLDMNDTMMMNVTLGRLLLADMNDTMMNVTLGRLLLADTNDTMMMNTTLGRLLLADMNDTMAMNSTLGRLLLADANKTNDTMTLMGRRLFEVVEGMNMTEGNMTMSGDMSSEVTQEFFDPDTGRKLLKGVEAYKKLRQAAGVGAGAPITSKAQWTPLHFAAYHGDVEDIQALIEVGDDVNAKEMNGWTPLHVAAFYGNSDATQALIDAQALVNEQTHLGKTALWWAASYDYPLIVKILLENGADSTIADDEGRTPSDVATGATVKFFKPTVGSHAQTYVV